jgi:hypothetical protein
MNYIMMILSILTLSSTPTKKVDIYKLSDGTLVSCRIVMSRPCGFSLLKCDNGKSYTCQSNVEFIGQYHK